MNELTVFEFNNSEYGDLVIIERNGENCFIGKEACDRLEYLNASKAIKDHCDERDVYHLTYEEAKSLTITNRYSSNLDIANRYIQNISHNGMLIVNESGFYSLVFGSKMPKAKEFLHWVTSEVLPSIRKNGMYAVDDLLDNPEMAAKVFQKLADERKANAMLTNKVATLEPKAKYCDEVLNNEDVMPLHEFVKDYGINAWLVNDFLEDSGRCFRKKRGGKVIPKAPYDKEGYMATKTSTDGKTVYGYTQKGRWALDKIFREIGVLPIEIGGSAIQNETILRSHLKGYRKEEQYSMFDD